MRAIAAAALLMLSAASTSAKLPSPSPAEAQRAAEAAARAAWGTKVDNYKLCKAQDRVAAEYFKRTGKSSGSSAAAVEGTCTDPGPFTYTPSEQKPLEAAGAHSPPTTAAAPPSTKTPDAAIKQDTK